MSIKHTSNKYILALRVASVALISLAAYPAGAAEVNLYTTREPGLIKPLLDAFSAAHDTQVNAIFVRDGLAERVAAEGRLSPADVLMTVDFGNLIDLADKGLTQPVDSEVLTGAIPENLRDEAGHWFTLSMRGRVLYTSKERVSATEFNYEDLAAPEWRDKVCIRSGQHPYNTAMIAAYIEKYGEAKAEEWLRGVKANLARRAGGGDRDVARDILGGICDIGIANSYYVGLMRSGNGGPEQLKWGNAINVILPTFVGGGTHVNISGAAIAKNAPNRDSAVKLLEYLVSDDAQELYAKVNFEYPVKAGAALDPIIDSMGTLRVDAAPIADISKYRAAASTLVDKVGFDN